MTKTPVVTACAVIIGNEILSGRTQDTNLNYLAKGLNAIGIRLIEARIIPDVEAVIVATVNQCRAAFDYVITTGGIGPTHDDITSAAIAKAFGLPLLRNPDAVARLRQHYSNPADLTAPRLKMADMPEGAILIDNPVSTVPGFQIGNVLVLAGVPAIMQAMFDGAKHRLRTGAPMLSRTLSCRLTEGPIAPGLTAIQGQFPDLEIGSYPFFRDRRFGLSIVVRGADAARAQAAAVAVADLMRSLGDEPIED